MIQKLTNNWFAAVGFSAVILTAHTVFNGQFSSLMIWESALVLLMGIGLNIVCKRFSIIGRESQLPLVIFALLGVVIIPILSLKALVAGFIWLVAVYFAFDSWEEPERANQHLIYIGVLLGVAQTLDEFSVFLFIPFFLLFYQNAVFQLRYYLLSVVYFILVLLCFSGVLYVMEIPEKIWNLLPVIQADLSAFTTYTMRVMLPVLVLLIVNHLLRMGSYPFRYPNRSININMLFLYQLLIAAAMVLISAAPGLFILLSLPASILMAGFFTFLQERASVQGLFYALIIASLCVGAFFQLWLV